MSQSRQLAAIMFTDIVGYTALMGKDSDKALELIRISKEIQKPLVEKHNGKWLKEMGDGAMAQFSTALDAVNCSIEIQEIARGKLDAKLRIGIHLGDVTVEEDDVYGDGVNVASRLESIADPGGIYISESVEKAIQGQSEVPAKYLGEVRLKNVSYGLRTYALQGVGLPIPEVKDEKELSGHFLAELQRRGVVRAGVAYTVVTLLLILLLREGQNWLTLPELSLPILITALVVGFPLAMYFAWNYERSPKGFVRTSSQQSWQNPYKASQRKPLTGNFIIIGLILVIITMYVYQRLSTTEADSSVDTTVTIDDKSIAVIPFINMSDDPAQEYFSDGMMEEILNHLVQIEDLAVVSRTTAMYYKGKSKTVQEIGKELGVAHILEGSVRKQGNRVRIMVQLIDVATDRHLWSDSYDRDLNDVFAIQSEVAQQVAASLQAQVHPEVSRRFEGQPTSSTEAYSLFLQARFYLNNFMRLEEAQYLLESALELDPEFALAHAKLGHSWMLRGIYFGDVNPSIAREHAMQALKKAIELDDQLAEAHNQLSFVHLFFDWDFESAERERIIAAELNPDQELLNVLGMMAMGRFTEALVISEKAVLRNPKDVLTYDFLALGYSFDNQHEKALEAAKQIELLSISPNTHAECKIIFYAHKYQEVIENVMSIYETNAELIPYHAGYLACAYFLTNQEEKTNPIIEQLKQKAALSSVRSPSFYLAMIYSQMGEIDTAYEWLDKAYEDHEVEMFWLKVEPSFEPLRSDPRWQGMLDKVGFPE